MACLRRVVVVAVPAEVAGLHQLRVLRRCRVLLLFPVVRPLRRLQDKAEEVRAVLQQEPARAGRRQWI